MSSDSRSPAGLSGCCPRAARRRVRACAEIMSADGGDFRVRAYAKGMSCRTAKRIVREFRVLKRGIIGNDESYRLRRYPGWRCYEGAGGGSCGRGSRVAAWQVRVPGASFEPTGIRIDQGWCSRAAREPHGYAAGRRVSVRYERALRGAGRAPAESTVGSGCPRLVLSGRVASVSPADVSDVNACCRPPH